MNRFLKRLRAFRRRKEIERDIEDEMAFHLEMKAAETGDRSEAQRRFGNVTAIQESCRQMWTFSALEIWLRDFRHALRTLVRNPTVSCVTLAAVALGTGINTTVFSVVSSALSFNMGVDEIERLVMIAPAGPNRSFRPFLDPGALRTGIHTIDHLAAYRALQVNISDSHGLPESYRCVQMSVSGWGLVNRKPMLGRAITADDERADAPPTILLSHKMWQNRYGSDPSIPGQLVRVDEVPRVVIGVMPAGMQFPEDTDSWIPLKLTDLLARPDQPMPIVFGRLADGATLAAANKEIDGIARRLTPASADRIAGPVAAVRPFLEIIGVYAARYLLIAVVCAVGFVLLIVCADVAGLLLSQAEGRAREISIRMAIGAARPRIIRQLLMESFSLATAGGLGGWLVALAGLHWFDVLTSKGPRPSWMDFSMNGRAFLYLAGISIGAGILFGLAPALRLSGIDVNSAIKDGGSRARGGRRGHRLLGALVVFQMALCVTLLAGAGLLIRSSVNLYNAPLVVNPSNVLGMRIVLPAAKYSSPERQMDFYGRLKRQISAIPGVQQAALASQAPLGGWTSFRGEFEGQRESDPDYAPEFGALEVSADYFTTMQVPLRRGRFFEGNDAGGGAGEVIVNETFASRFWPGENPLGKRLRRADAREPGQWLSVIGVVPDIPQAFSHPLEKEALIYVPYAAAPPGSIFVLARTTVPPATLVRDFRAAVASLDRDLPVQEVSSIEDRIARQRLNVTAFGVLFTIFAVMAVALASIGLYATMAQAVSRRSQEIGIRMAIGAGRFDIFKLVLDQGIRQVAIGFAAGLPLAFAATRILRGALVGVSPSDPAAFVAALVVLTVAAILGCAIPAIRAIRVEPQVTLRLD